MNQEQSFGKDQEQDDAIADLQNDDAPHGPVRVRVYYAHCLAIYDTPQEARDMQTLFRLGFDPYNPNSPEVEAKITAHKAANPNGNYMEFFRSLVTGCDALVFRALPDGRIPAGVAKEIDYAREANMPVFELPSRILGRTIGVEETREYLREVGQR